MDVAGVREEGSETIFQRTSCCQITDGVPILTFDPSVDNFLSIMEAISKLCGEAKEESFETSEIEQFKSMIIFISEWKQFYFCEWMPFCYKPKTVNFTYQTESVEAKNAIKGIKLPHFSSAAIPKAEKLPHTTSALDNDDFVFHVGGSVWSLDWCPRLYENIDCDVKCEYLAVAAHPVGSEYHKIGEQLSGRGFIQIWCFLHLGGKEELLNPRGIALPRLVSALAHNGKVAWDMKWRPSDAVDSKGKHHLGYLAVLLGNGSLEVWKVPVHSLVKFVYAGCHTDGTDPRFLKLQPVFRCSRLKFGDRQSIPLTLEWSPSASRDLILAGCHDGMVALWKFSSQLSSQDTKPLLCFTADTVAIRCLAWAPNDSDVECSNLIVTAGYEGLKFWDLRSPYRPLMDVCPVQRAVLGLDWLKDPRCVVIAYEDGIMRTLSLTKMANNMPFTGELMTRTKQQGLHFQSCSFFAIWSVQVSRRTGLVAYCSSDGCTRYFQLTAEAVEKDSSRYRKPHFLCGSLAEEGPTLSINTPLTSVPLPKQPLVSKVAANEARPMQALCSYDDYETRNNSSQKKRKCNPSKQASGDGVQDIEIKGDKSRQNVARFPPKIVAMHKVRWNMNKGSGRWLCYGGAAGIVRCQAISLR
ncbi:hypothetical protein KFK09_007182 [Dendrobium nobile]|uniref:General transcription factor 3C polypeptide 2 n=1 Tax=Dendrobium nobile TaxID=94219 RepID=A0A8T3BW43_DENNO|nr:hypothetical protein KFK09_007182 [Dendrobium nobile]